jgi:PilZ domain
LIIDGLKLPLGPWTDHEGLERRGKPRLYEAFPVKVRGSDESGHAFEAEALLDNLSVSGLYVFLPHNVEQGTVLTVTIRLSSAESLVGSAARVLTHGVVVRVKPRADGYYGLAIAFKHYRSL